MEQEIVPTESTTSAGTPFVVIIPPKRRRTQGPIWNLNLLNYFTEMPLLLSMDTTDDNSSSESIVIIRGTRRATSVDSFSSVFSQATSANSVAGRFKSDITAAELGNLLQCESKRSKCILLVDCRDAARYQTGRIKFPQCVNVPIQCSIDAASGFTSKAEVVQFMQVHCSTLVRHLNLPGFYDDVVIYDEQSTLETVSKPVKLIIQAIKKWNETTKTRILVLEGGIQKWSQEFPNLLQTDTDGVDLPVSICRISHTAVGQQELSGSLFTPSPSTSTGNNEVIKILRLHLGNLDLAIGTTTSLINLKGYLKSFESVQHVLLQEQEQQLTKELDNRIPTEVKCPVCYDVFEKEIFQCRNGHCICATCCGSLTVCPECRQNYWDGTVQVRNRALEQLLANTLKVTCTGCGETLLFTRAQQHVKVCVSKRIAEVIKIEAQIKLTETEIEKYNEKLEQLNKVILDTEHRWISGPGDDVKKSKVVTDAAGKKILEDVFARKLTLSTLNVALLSAIFLKSEVKFKVTMSG